MKTRAEILQTLRDELAPNGRGASLLAAMFDRARRIPEYAEDMEDWLSTGDWLMLRRAAAPFGDFHGSASFAGALYELDATLTQAREPETTG